MSLKFHQALIRPSIRGLLLKELYQTGQSGRKPLLTKSIVRLAPPSSCLDLHVSLAALNINKIQTPPLLDPTKARIPPPLPVSRIIELPQVQGNITYEDQLPTKSVEEPSSSAVLEKQAARLIVIRRKKMKTHKLKKLRKKMKFVWAKERQKRELKKEKIFQAELIEKIKLAQSFDPAKYAAEKIARANEVELPVVWYGVKYPEHIIKQLIEEQEMKTKQIESDKKRKESRSPYVKDYLDKLPK